MKEPLCFLLHVLLNPTIVLSGVPSGNLTVIHLSPDEPVHCGSLELALVDQNQCAFDVHAWQSIVEPVITQLVSQHSSEPFLQEIEFELEIVSNWDKVPIIAGVEHLQKLLEHLSLG